MSSRVVSSALRIAVAGLAGALLFSGCASSASAPAASEAGDAGAVGYFNVETGGDKVDGGTLTFGSYSFPNALDPTLTFASGSTGGTEMAAVYDTLLRAEDGEFVPQLAKSLEHNDDFTSFTITLRDGVTFSDGSALDADAVKWSIDRFVAGKADVAQAWADIVQEITTPDKSTVQFTLKRSWDDFPVMLSMGPGMVIAKSSEASGKFTPIGAGPFTLQKFSPNEELVLARRADYYGGKPALETVRFVPTTGPKPQLESMQSGQLNMAYILRDPEVIRDVRQNPSYAGYYDVVGLGTLGMINNSAGHPGADVRVRQAIAYGIDPEAINERASNGLGIASSEILPESSRWNSGVEGIKFDPEKAKTLLGQAKADGYNGKLTYVTYQEPSAQAAALAVQAALNTVGFDVQIDNASSVTDFVRKMYVDREFDLALSAAQFMDEAPYLRLYNILGSTSQLNAGGYKDPETDQLLTEVQTATTDDAKRAAIGKVQTQINETAPFALWGPVKVLLAWDAKVHGVKRTSDNIVLLDSVWIDR